MAANRFDQLIDEWDERLRKAFLDSVNALRDRAQIDNITRMLERGDVDGALRAVGLDPTSFRPFDRALAGAYEAGGNATANLIPTIRQADGLRMVVQFNIRNPVAERWLTEKSANAVKEIMDDQRAMIREHLRIGMEQGLNPRTVALDLVGRIGANGNRFGGVIGLTSTQAQWVRNYAVELATNPAAALSRNLRDRRFDAAVRKAVETEQPIPAELRQKMVTTYKNRALRYRAEAIARTEAMHALHSAQEEAVFQAIASGVDQDTISFVWHTAKDQRVRDSHRFMDGQQRPYGKNFLTGAGSQLRFPGDDFAPPSETINCRCWREMKVDFLAGVR